MSEFRKRRPNNGLRNRTGSGEIPHRNHGNTQSQNHGHNHGHGHGHARDRDRNRSQGQQAPLQRTYSHDRVRKIVQEEGRTARNLITWRVPMADEDISEKAPQQSKRNHHRSPSGGSITRGVTNAGKQRHRDRTPVKKTGEDGKSNSRPSSRSGSGNRRTDLRARYWAFLFDNLQRAVDEIYQTCEADESEVECKEVIMMLEQCTKDFKSLIETLQIMKAYENAEEGHKPTSLAWEVRKTASPGKSLVASNTQEPLPPSPAQRALNFNIPEPAAAKDVLPSSWADKVRTMPGAVKQTNTAMIVQDEDDTEGWETVQRGKMKTRGSPLQKIPGSFGPTSDKSHISASDKSQSASDKKHVSRADKKYTPASEQQAKNNPHFAKTNQNLRNSVQGPLHDSHETGDKNKTAGLRSPAQVSPAYRDALLSPPKREAVFLASHNHVNGIESKDSEKENRPSSLNIDRNEAVVSVIKEVSKTEFIDDLYRNQLESIESPNDDQIIEEELSKLHESTDEERDQDEEALTSELENVLESILDEEANLTNQLQEEQEEAIQSAIQEEQTWLKELQREESTDILVETENEAENEAESDLGNTSSTLESSQQVLDWDTMVANYDAAEAEGAAHQSWGEMVDDAETRTPGRVVHMHEKLSSPSRKRSPTESRKRYEEKHAKAQELREKLLQEKAERLRDLSKKVEEVRAWKEELLRQRRETIELKLERAEEKRKLQLKHKVKKAHEEENKANEIAFILTLEAENKRHDIMSKHQESEARLQDLQEERQRKHEEKAAKEAAVEERRRALEAERQARLQEMQERRKKRESEIDQQQAEREKERLTVARTKEKERQERIAALNAQQQQHIEELQKKIQMKQDESARRHKENLEQIREKAFEMSVLKHSTEDHNDAPRLVPYDRKKICTVCNVMIPSEVYLLSHLRGKKHSQAIKDVSQGRSLTKEEIETFNLKHITNAPCDTPDPQEVSERERLKALKKRCKKLRQRMTSRGLEYENTVSGKQLLVESQNKARLQKSIKDINKYLQSAGSGPWPQSRVLALDRALGEIARVMEKKVAVDQQCVRVCLGLTALNRVLGHLSDTSADLPAVIPLKTLVHCCNVLHLLCKGNYDNCHYMLFSNLIGSLIDLLLHQLDMVMPQNSPQNGSIGMINSALTLDSPHRAVCTSLMQLIASVLSCLAKNNPTVNSSDASAERMSGSGDAFMSRASDVISYIVSVGAVDRLTLFFSSIRGPVQENVDTAEFLQSALRLLTAMTKLVSKRNLSIFEEKKADDSSQLVSTFKATELVGIVSLMYGMLLHSGVTSRGDTAPPQMCPHTLAITTMGIKMLNHMATLDLNMLQLALGAEGTSLQFRHIASYLVWYSSHWTNDELIHEVILSVGYFTVLNADNQMIIQSGQPPSVLQQLCSLPFQYFSDPRLTSVLFPTLISCCYSNSCNMDILKQELSSALLANFIEAKTLEVQQNLLNTGSLKKTKTPEKNKAAESDNRLMLAARFPQKLWTQAHQYFHSG